MQRAWSRWLCRAGFCLPLVLAGCGSGGPPLARVSGTVTLDGKPLTRGTVQFAPDANHGTTGPTGVGDIDATGHYEIRTLDQNGAVVGFHVVGVVAREAVDLNQTSFAPSLIPERYNNPLSSGLTAEVQPGQRNTVDLQLTSAP